MVSSRNPSHAKQEDLLKHVHYQQTQSGTYIFGQHVSILFSSGPIQGYRNMLSKNVCTALCLLIVISPPTKNLFKHVHQKRKKMKKKKKTEGTFNTSFGKHAISAAPHTGQPPTGTAANFCCISCHCSQLSSGHPQGKVERANCT